MQYTSADFSQTFTTTDYSSNQKLLHLVSMRDIFISLVNMSILEHQLLEHRKPYLATIIPGIEAIRCMEIGTECFVEFMTGRSR